jgi:iron complex transport system ATP-binding protein
MLCALDLSVARKGRTLLREVRLAVPSGSLVAVLGPNGAGKTTLLRALSGDLAPSGGQVLMAGRPIEQWSLAERARCRAILQQDYALGFPLRCIDVVLLGRTPHQSAQPSPEQGLTDRLIARAALDAVELCHRADDPYDALSGGQQQLVQFARVLAQIWDSGDRGAACPPRYLLLDEPTASLDLRHQHVVLSRARRLAADGVAVLAILHDINLAAQYADTLVLLDRGRVAAQGSPAEVLTADRIGAVFGVAATRIDTSLGIPLVMAAAHAESNPSPHTRYAHHARISADHPVHRSHAEK